MKKLYLESLQKGIVPELEVFDNVRRAAAKKAQAVIVQMKAEMEKVGVNVLMNPEEMIAEGVRKIHSVKDQLIKRIETYFEHLESNYRGNVRLNYSQVDDVNPVYNRVRELEDDLQRAAEEVLSLNPLQTLDDLLRLDSRGLITSMCNNIQNVVKNKSMFPTHLVIDEPRINSIYNELRQCIRLAEIQEEKRGTSGGLGKVVAERMMKKPQERSTQQLAVISQSQVTVHSGFYGTGEIERPVSRGMHPTEAPRRPPTTGGRQNHSPRGGGPSSEDFPVRSAPHPVQSSPDQQIRPPQEQVVNHFSMFRRQDFDPFSVHMPEFFEEGAEKLLHFYDDKTNTIYTLDLPTFNRTKEVVFREKELTGDIPQYCQTVITSQGQIFMMGGQDKNDSSKKLADVALIDVARGTLERRARMARGRSSFTVSYIAEFIFAIGGLGDGDVALPYCEKYRISNNQWNELQALPYGLSKPTCTSFDNRFIYLVGGITPEKKINPKVLRYELAANQWSEVSLRLSEKPPAGVKVINFESGVAQINPNEVLVFGGLNEKKEPVDTTFIIRVSQNEGGNSISSIMGINKRRLPFSEGIDNEPIVFANRLFALQYITKQNDPTQIFTNNRRILIYDGIKWEAYSNTVSYTHLTLPTIYSV
eukprot:TRINITY_DN8706_c0_g1_i1.p1 TRINITY_DN8706_c0_g1~~TRINITY_DN8706_c0_g1_i1.p1  ORF type:complete len:645 (-),score=128.02 TRINITY_DN8706_c0_g1_i1:33-1967(-)